MTKMSTAAIERHKAKDRYIGVFPLEFDDAGAEDDAPAIPGTIHLIPIGQWEHDLYGPILITAGDIREFVQNFNAGVRKGVFITAGHEGYEEQPAVGWITQVEARDDGLWGDVEWNDLGKGMLSDKQFKFFSPEFCRDYEDPQSHQIYRNVIVGGALTKSPYFKELEAIVFSDKKLKKFNDTMDLKALLAKKPEELSDAEKAFVKEHSSELSDEQKTAFKSVIEPAVAETEEEKATREEKEKGDANEAAGLNRDGSEKAKVEASDRKVVTMSSAEYDALKGKADQGAEAFAELKKQKMSSTIATLMFSESNKNGRFLPKSKDTLRAFMESLNDAQLAKFSALIAELPKTELFNEKGSDNTVVEGSVKAELNSKVETKLKASKEAGKPMKYSDAVRAVFSENPGLDKRYDDELAADKAQK